MTNNTTSWETCCRPIQIFHSIDNIQTEHMNNTDEETLLSVFQIQSGNNSTRDLSENQNILIAKAGVIIDARS